MGIFNQTKCDCSVDNTNLTDSCEVVSNCISQDTCVKTDSQDTCVKTDQCKVECNTTTSCSNTTCCDNIPSGNYLRRRRGR